MNDLTIVLIMVIAALSIGVSNILCFLFGFRTGLKVNRVAVDNEPIKPILPKLKNPMEIYKEKEAQKEYEREIEDIRKSIENIDNYGSDKPQQEI